jgi:glutathione synthase/RimK-type ligase-like ATP-grasp enzyme
MILIISNEEDLTADYVVLELERRGLPFLRINTENYPVSIHLEANYEESSRNIYITHPNGKLDINTISSIWYRRPGSPCISSNISNPSIRNYAFNESLAFLQSFYKLLPDKWLNHPFNISAAESKPYQLSLAQKVGFNIPNTIITTSPKNILQFYNKHNGKIIAKPVRNASFSSKDGEYIVYTSRVNNIDISSFSLVQYAPSIFQQEITKKLDLRVTIVDSKLFCAAIESQTHEETMVDWRRGEIIDLKHKPFSLPKDIRKMCFKLLNLLNLRFGAIDLILSSENNYYFLEINPNGQWAWIEERLDFPISAAIVDALEI